MRNGIFGLCFGAIALLSSCTADAPASEPAPALTEQAAPAPAPDEQAAPVHTLDACDTQCDCSLRYACIAGTCTDANPAYPFPNNEPCFADCQCRYFEVCILDGLNMGGGHCVGAPPEP